MNKTKIEWTDYTWNPVTGCFHGCYYCYARRMSERFRGRDLNDGAEVVGSRDSAFSPRFYRKRLAEPKKIKRSSKIFVVSMGDLFGSWVPAEWIETVIDVVKSCPRHTFQFLTKNPGRYKEFDWPENAWLGATAINQGMYFRAVLSFAEMSSNNIKFISLEPLISAIDLGKYVGIGTWIPDWVIVGALTMNGVSRIPAATWIDDIVDIMGTWDRPLFLKDNLKWPKKIQNFPC